MHGVLKLSELLIKCIETHTLGYQLKIYIKLSHVNRSHMIPSATIAYALKLRR